METYSGVQPTDRLLSESKARVIDSCYHGREDRCGGRGPSSEDKVSADSNHSRESVFVLLSVLGYNRHRRITHPLAATSG